MRLCCVLSLAVMAFAGGASADLVKGAGSGDALSGDGVGGVIAPAGSLRTGIVCNFDVTGIESWDAVGSVNNTIVQLDVAACAGLPSGTPVAMNGIGWDVNLTALNESWLSELRVYFDDNVAPDLTGLFLRPGAGTNTPGTAPFNSGGIIKLSDAGIPDIPLPNGVLRMEFHESFDDVANAIDGTWDSGALNIQITPEPATLALLALGGLGLIRRRR